MTEHLDLERIRKLHKTRGGNLNWPDIVEQEDLDMSPDAIRFRVSRFEIKNYGQVRPDFCHQ